MPPLDTLQLPDKMKPITAIIILISHIGLTSAQNAPRLGPGRKYTTIERLQAKHLQSVHADRLRFSKERKSVTLSTGYNDYRVVLHAYVDATTHTGGCKSE